MKKLRLLFIFILLSGASSFAAESTLQIQPHHGPSKTWKFKKKGADFFLNGTKIPANLKAEINLFQNPKIKKSKEQCDAGRWFFTNTDGKSNTGCLEDGSSGGLIRAVTIIESKAKKN